MIPKAGGSGTRQRPAGERKQQEGSGGCGPQRALTDIGAQEAPAELRAVAGGRGAGLCERRSAVIAAAAARTLSGLPSARGATEGMPGGAPEPSFLWQMGWKGARSRPGRPLSSGLPTFCREHSLGPFPEPGKPLYSDGRLAGQECDTPCPLAADPHGPIHHICQQRSWNGLPLPPLLPDFPPPALLGPAEQRGPAAYTQREAKGEGRGRGAGLACRASSGSCMAGPLLDKAQRQKVVMQEAESAGSTPKDPMCPLTSPLPKRS